MFASFKSILVCGALALAAAAQNINIALPSALTTVHAGDNITVQVEKPVSVFAPSLFYFPLFYSVLLPNIR